MKSAIACALVGTLCFPPFAPVAADVDISHDYGVFLGASPADIDYMKEYDTIVIDAQNFSADQIAQLKEGGHTVFSYINVGSVENFRPYYSEYEDLTSADYDNWPEERWVDVSEDEWQEFILDDLAPSILDKGVDGLFVDNADVYYVAAEEGLYDGDPEDIYYGLENILENLASMDTYVCINGGDTFVWEYKDRDGDLEDIMDAVNQESVFSAIEDYDNDIFGTADEGDHEYFTEYVEMCADECIDVYLLEYTTDADLISEIDAYCRDMEFAYYASPSVKLIAGEAESAGTGVVVPENTEVYAPESTEVSEPVEEPETYGVFLGAASDTHHLTAEDIEYMRNFDVIVIDAMYCSEEEIAALKEGGHTVWSYLNVGSLEDFREGYEEFLPYTFMDYDNWPEERWIDVSETAWQDHIISLANDLKAKGVEGFYIDNLDVYWVALNEDNEFVFDFAVDPDAIYDGIVNILDEINTDDTYIMINGGDTFVWAYEETGDISKIMDGVNQESVFSNIIDYDNDIFGTQDDADHDSYTEYVEMVGDAGLGVHLLEYTTDSAVIDQIDAYCDAHGYSYYVSSSIRLIAVSDPDEVNVFTEDDEDDEDDEEINLNDYDDVVLDDDYGDFDFYADVETEPEVIELDPADDNDEPVEVVVDDSDIAELESDADELDGLQDYGVFLGVTPDEETHYIDPSLIAYMRGYRTIVIDAQYYTADQIAALKEGGRTVLSYINIGSLEDFRDYYGDYAGITFAEYDNWPGEYWVDVSEDSWQDFILGVVAPSILAKGADGFFVDNVDVYYVALNEEHEFDFYRNVDANAVFDGVATILSGLQAMDAYVCINGGDTFVTAYYENGGNLSDVMDAVNQESVFSTIRDYDRNVFGTQSSGDHSWYMEYVQLVASQGLDVYLLEYTTDTNLIGQIDGYCDDHGFSYYASSTVQLLVND